MTGVRSDATARTPRQQFWLEHLRACREQGLTLRAYARTHRLSISALYAANAALKRREAPARNTLPVVAPKFVPVHVARSTALFRVLLPNGVALEVPEHADTASCRELLALVSALP